MGIENFFYPRELNLRTSPLGMIQDTKKKEKCWKTYNKDKATFAVLPKKRRKRRECEFEGSRWNTPYLRILAGPYERPAEYLDLVYRLVSNYIHLKKIK